MISMAVASSTYLTLLLHLTAIPLTRMQKSRVVSLVPCGVSPLSPTGGDNEFPILTCWLLFVKKAAIHLTRWGSTSKLFSWFSSTLWSTRSKPLLKSEKKILMYLPQVSSVSKIMCIKKIRAWSVEHPGRGKCLLSSLLNTLVIRDSAENLSSTLAIGEVSELGLKSFSTDFGGRNFGTGTTMACFSCLGK